MERQIPDHLLRPAKRIATGFAACYTPQKLQPDSSAEKPKTTEPQTRRGPMENKPKLQSLHSLRQKLLSRRALRDPDYVQAIRNRIARATVWFSKPSRSTTDISGGW